MATYQHHAYATSALVHDIATGAMALSAGHDPVTDRPLVTITEAEALTGADRTAVATRPDGTVIASGPLHECAYATIRDESTGDIRVDRIEVGGLTIGYVASRPLMPGRSYLLIQSDEIGFGHDEPPSYSALGAFPGFVAGAMIATDQGELPVDWIRPGDRLLTRDNGYRPVLWSGRHRPTPDGTLVEIAAGAFGPGLPAHPLRVGPDHRILLGGAALDLHFGEEEMFAAADFLGESGVVTTGVAAAEPLHHLLLAEHEVILAEGLWVESLLAGPEFLSAQTPATRRHVAELAGKRHRQTARACLTRSEVAMLVVGGILERIRIAA